MLDQLSEEERFVIILIFWRNWSDRNSITHGGGRLSIDASSRAIRALQKTFSGKQLNIIDDVKGKFPLNVLKTKTKGASGEANTQALVATTGGRMD